MCCVRSNVPTLWITADEDIVYPPFLSDILAKMMPNARVTQIARCGHSAYFERPAEFNQAVDEFLSANGGLPHRNPSLPNSIFGSGVNPL